MLIIPAIDIKMGKCVRLTQGNYDTEVVYSDNPLEVAKTWEKTGAKCIHIVDLDGARTGKLTNLEVIKKIAKTLRIPLQVGGGLRDKSAIQDLLGSGISRVVLGTVVFEDDLLLRAMLKKYADRVMIALDARHEKLLIRGWLKRTNKNLIETAKYLEDLGSGIFIYTDIVRDGTMTKPNYKQIELLLNSVNIPLIVSGGIATLQDIKRLKSMGVFGAILGKALYEGKLNLKEAISVS